MRKRLAESASEYRTLELQALQEAAKATDPQARAGLMQYADLWRAMAEAAEQADDEARPPTADPTT